MTARTLPARRIGRLFVVAGLALVVMGLLPWSALLVGATSVVLLVLGTLAVAVGAVVALMGLGVLQRVAERAAAATEHDVDLAAAEIIAATTTAGSEQPSEGAGACAPGAACGTCGGTCALSALGQSAPSNP